MTRAATSLVKSSVRSPVEPDARALLAAIVESSSDAITTATMEGVVTSWNRAAERLYGYKAAQIIGQNIRLIVPSERLPELRSKLHELARGEMVPPFETIRRRKNGELIPVALTLSAIRNAAGRIVGASGIARDVRERRQLEAEILQAAEREKRRIAHDLHDGLGQWIAGIGCLANVLQENLARDKSRRAPLAARIASLINEATGQTRGLAHGLYPVPAEPRGLMTALDALRRRTAELFHVDCSFHCPKTVLVKETAVANHLYRIAQEAVSNALRHGSPRHIRLDLLRTPGRLVLGISDDGTGIRKRRAGARGIGLRIMRYRADLLFGTLAVQRRPLGGTEVVCTVNQVKTGSTYAPEA